MSWSMLLMGLLLGADGPPGAEDYYDFRGKEFDLERLTVVGDQKFIQRENGGLRITVPGDATDENVGIAASRQVVGDFEITGRFELSEVPKPADGYGTGATLLITDSARYGASLQRVRTSADEEIFVAHHYVVDFKGEYEHSAKNFPTACRHGMLRFVRAGSRLQYMIAEGDSQEFRELLAVEFTDKPLKSIQAYAQPGGARNAVDVVWSDLRIRAEMLLEPGQTPPAGSSPWITWLAIIFVISTPIVAVGVWWWKTKTRVAS